jgi:hypothetical protein
MTAHAGDALSHVNFLHRSDVVLTVLGRLKTPFDRAAEIARPSRERRFRPYLHGGHEGSGRNEPGLFFSFEHYLNKSSPRRGLQY